MAKKTKTIAETHALEDDPLWYKDAIIYELHIKTFKDSDGDGIGDFRGAIEKLDYLQDLGVTALWVLPFYPSPQKDDGYDIAEYTQVNPDYGTLADFKRFVREAHVRGMRVITELVVNHTSDQHPWFQQSRRAAPGSKWRNYYVWSDKPDRYREARIIFKDFEPSNWSYDPRADAYFWHRFYSHQPDLNYENPEVHKAIIKVLEQWMDYGVDGFRLDAVPYLYEEEGTDCENLPRTHDFLRKLRKHIDDNYKNRLLLAEANQWPEDAAAYFGNGDECHMNFHFPLMPRMFMAVRLEDSTPIIDILEQTPTIDETCQWATFLRNHDELTLEMVTDEERDYMYRMYAQDPRMRINLGIRRRLCPLLLNNRRTIELMNSLLFSLKGTPVIYYGDEIGMGDNIYLGDRNGVRTPMQWSADRNAGFSAANPQRLYLPVIVDPEYHYESVNVEAQQNNPSSLLWWMKRLIAIRKQYRAFSRGTLEFLHPSNRKVLTYLRRYEGETILCVVNLSRFSQFVELDLAHFQGMTPVEIFGHNEFPPIGEWPYLLTLAPHTFYWFDLRPAAVGQAPIAAEDEDAPALSVSGEWTRIFAPRNRSKLQQILPKYLQHCRWFGGKSRRITGVELAQVLPLAPEDQVHIALLRVNYREGEPEMYSLPLSYAEGKAAEDLLRTLPRQAIVASLKAGPDQGLLYDAVHNPAFGRNAFETIRKSRRISTDGTALAGTGSPTARRYQIEHPETAYRILRAEQSNTSIIVDNRFILKLFRRIYEGLNPDYEIGRFLTDRQRFPHVPAVQGSLEFQAGKRDTRTLGVLQDFVPNEGDAWTFTLDQVRNFYADLMAHSVEEPPPAPEGLFDPVNSQAMTERLVDLLHGYPVFARFLGRRTAEMHQALGSDPEAPGFSPEPFTPHYRRSLYQSMRNTLKSTFTALRRSRASLSDDHRDLAQAVMDREKAIDAVFKGVMDPDLTPTRIRIHGDYHLGQVLSTGADVVIIDFEGEPARPITERRLRKSPLQDVAGMLRSFHYAAHVALHDELEHGVVREEDLPYLRKWADTWVSVISGEFLEEYLDIAGDAEFVPTSRKRVENLLRALMLDKALYEVNYEINNRPAWVDVPLQAILQLTEDTKK